MGSVKEVTQSDFSTEVLQADTKVVVDFWADWCQPCRMVAPEVEKLAQRNPDIKVVKLNVDDAPLISTTYGIQGIPMIGLFNEGELVRRSVGAKGVDLIERELGL